jgi:pimeloyl-ACP methyl ester carboxylesterase
MNLWQLLLLVACALFLGNLAVHLVYALVALRRFENRPLFEVSPAPADAPVPEPLSIPTSHGLVLRGGAYYPRDGYPRGVVIFCPETAGSFTTAMNYCQALTEAGFVVVAFSFRNQEPSDSLASYHATQWLTYHEIADVNAVINFVESQTQFAGLPIGLCGVSRGACAALACGAGRPEIHSIWAQGPFSTLRLTLHHSLNFMRTVVGRWVRFLPVWHVRTTIWIMLRMSEWRNGGTFVTLETLLPRWKGRNVMFVSGARDTYVPYQQTQQLCRLTGHTPEDSHWVVPHAKHNMERAAAPMEFDERIVSFFQTMLADHTTPTRDRKAMLKS